MNFEDLEWKTFEYMAKKLNFDIFIAKFVVLVHLSLKKKVLQIRILTSQYLVFIIFNRIQKVVMALCSFNGFPVTTIHKCKNQ